MTKSDNNTLYSQQESLNGKAPVEGGIIDSGAYLDDSFSSPSTGAPPTKRQPPPYVGSLGPEERAHAEKKLVRKVDLRLIPMIIIMYIMNYLDRNNIAAARLGGLEEDLNLIGNQYQTAVSILFVGYVLMQIPSNLYLNKVGKPSIYLPTAMVVWGVISGATAAVQNFAGLATVRFCLGFIEAAYFPGCLYYLSAWYTRKELGFRTALLVSGSLVSGACSGLIAAGIIGNLDRKLGLRAWRWLFIIEGAVTVAIAAGAYFCLPDLPRTTRWLSENEKELAVWRLDEDIGEDDWIDSQHQTFWGGMKMAALDIKMWILMVMLFCILSSASVNNFFPTVVQTLKYGRVESLLLTAPPYVLAVITAFVNAWHADRTGERYFHITLPLYIAVIAFIIAAATTDTAPRYLAMMLMPAGIYTGPHSLALEAFPCPRNKFPPLSRPRMLLLWRHFHSHRLCAAGYVVALGWISNCMPRPPAKRAAALAAINAVSNTSAIYASYMFPTSAGPRYVVAMSICSVTAFMAILSATALRVILVRLNHKIDSGEHVEGAINCTGHIPGEAAQRRFRFLA